MGTSFTLASTLQELLYARHIKLFAKALELFMHTVFQLTVILKTTSLECCLQGAKYTEVQRC
jgi:hypothetical protein